MSWIFCEGGRQKEGVRGVREVKDGEGGREGGREGEDRRERGRGKEMKEKREERGRASEIHVYIWREGGEDRAVEGRHNRPYYMYMYTPAK